MALTGRRSGMFRRDDVAALARHYVAECLAVARAEGAALGDEVVAELPEIFRYAPVDMGTSIPTDREAGRPMEWDIRNGCDHPQGPPARPGHAEQRRAGAVAGRRGRQSGLSSPSTDVSHRRVRG